MDRAQLVVEIKQLILKELDLRHRTEADILDDAPLFGVGLGLDSLDALQLAMALEERFHVAIPEGDEAKSVFASVSALAKHIALGRSKE